MKTIYQKPEITFEVILKDDVLVSSNTQKPVEMAEHDNIYLYHGDFF